MYSTKEKYILNVILILTGIQKINSLVIYNPLLPGAKDNIFKSIRAY